jgi:hypothetical protein
MILSMLECDRPANLDGSQEDCRALIDRAKYIVSPLSNRSGITRRALLAARSGYRAPELILIVTFAPLA